MLIRRTHNMKRLGNHTAILFISLLCRLRSSSARADEEGSGSTRQEAKLLKRFSAPSSPTAPWNQSDLPLEKLPEPVRQTNSRLSATMALFLQYLEAQMEPSPVPP